MVAHIKIEIMLGINNELIKGKKHLIHLGKIFIV